MLGLPTETREDVMQTLSMLKEIRPYHCSPAFYTPHPGSDLFEMGKEMGIHLITDHAAYRRNSYEPKIKGPDYDFLKEILYESIAAECKDDPDTSAAIRIKERVRKSLLRFPKLYGCVKAIQQKCRF